MTKDNFRVSVVYIKITFFSSKFENKLPKSNYHFQDCEANFSFPEICGSGALLIANLIEENNIHHLLIEIRGACRREGGDFPETEKCCRKW